MHKFVCKVLNTVYNVGMSGAEAGAEAVYSPYIVKPVYWRLRIVIKISLSNGDAV